MQNISTIMSNLDPNAVEAMESNSVESLLHTQATRIKSCSNKWARKIDEFLLTMISILSVLLLTLVLHRVGFLKDDDSSIPTPERDSPAIPPIERKFDAITLTKNVNYMEKFLNSTCRTNECKMAAIQSRNSMNMSSRPCNDFYEFVCGNNAPRNNPFVMQTFFVYIKLKTMIENTTDADQSTDFRLVKNFYNSCLNQTEIEAVGLDQFKGILRKIGGWPLIDRAQWNETDFDWIKSTRKLRDVGLTPNQLFVVEVGSNFKNSSIQSLMISQPEFKLPRHFLLNDTEPLLQKYYSSMVELAAMFGAHFDSFSLHEIVDVFTFERHLANISLPEEELRDYETQNNPFKISELEIKYPYIRWMDYFDAIMPADMKNITSDEEVIVITPTYFDRLGEVLQNTSNKTIANYFAWRILLESSKFLNDSVHEPTKHFVNSISSNVNVNSTRWVRCITTTTKVLAPAVGALYLRKLNNDTDESKKHVEQMVENIRNSFVEILNNATWLDESTKKLAVDKAKSTIAHVGFMKELSNATKIEHYYKSLTLNESEFLLNALRLNKFDLDHNFRHLYEPTDKNDWLKYPIPAKVGAFHIHRKNAILIPSAILQGAFYSDKRANFLNYGFIGQMIGHEIAHGFDDVGTQIDKNGNLKDWWLRETRLKFLNKTKCLIEQYGNFIEPNSNLKINGKLTQGEGIADNVGLKSAYYAYAKWLESNEDKPLPGMKIFTSKQMFWMSAARVWCPITSDVNQFKLMTADEHPPDRFRVIGPLINSKEFAKDFWCAPRTPMNPAEKCEIW